MLCKNYVEAEDGTVISPCSYEDKCMFAHGPRDLLIQGYEPLLCLNVPPGCRTEEPWCRCTHLARSLHARSLLVVARAKEHALPSNCGWG